MSIVWNLIQTVESRLWTHSGHTLDDTLDDTYTVEHEEHLSNTPDCPGN